MRFHLKKIFEFLHNTETAKQFKIGKKSFTRERSLPFPTVVTSILHLFKESVEYNLLSDKLKKIISGESSSAAFSKARYKVKCKFFKRLCSMTFSSYLRMSCKKRWKGFLVLGIDGSTSNLPSSKSIKSYFGVYATNKHGVNRYTARILMVYDVLNKFVLSARLSKMCFGESRLMSDCIKELAGKLSRYIYVMDRNFDSFSTIKSVLNMNAKTDLCIRLSSRPGFYKRVLADPSQDFITSWEPSPKEKRSCKSKEISSEPIQVRVTKVVLSTGEIEILISTLLDQRKYTRSDMATLYSLRWGIEEGFKNLKPKMKLEYYGCKKPAGVYQEFYAHIFMMNLVALHGMIASLDIEEGNKTKKYDYAYNWKNSYRFVRESIIDYLFFSRKIKANLEKIIQKITHSLVAIIPGRKFVRDMRWNEVKTRITSYNK
ncbi:MAG: IS4 family transposase [Bacteroidota bacterium]